MHTLVKLLCGLKKCVGIAFCDSSVNSKILHSNYLFKKHTKINWMKTTGRRAIEIGSTQHQR